MILDFFGSEDRINRDDFVNIFSRKDQTDYTQLVSAHGVRNFLHATYKNTPEGKSKSPDLRNMFKNKKKG